MTNTAIQECIDIAEWKSYELDRMTEHDFRLLVVKAIADLASRTDAILDRLAGAAEQQ